MASNLLKSVATQFADRRLFLFLFNYPYDAIAEEVFSALGASLPAPQSQGEGEGEGAEEDSGGMTMVSPVTYFLQVCLLFVCLFVCFVCVCVCVCVCVHMCMCACACLCLHPSIHTPQDAVNSQNFLQDVHALSLVHLALYVEKTPLSLATMFKNMNLLEAFCRKLRNTAVSHPPRLLALDV